jgi:hypothetical protein
LPEGHLTVLAHGAGGIIVQDHRPSVGLEGILGFGALKAYMPRRVSLDGEDLSRLLAKRYPNIRPGMTIVMATCFAGGAPHPGYPTNIAQYVANSLRVNVIAPTGRLSLSGGAFHSIINTDGSQGTWERFSPSGR